MIYTVVYLEARRMPHETFKMEINVSSADQVMFEFLNNTAPGRSGRFFVAAIFEGPASRVSGTRPQWDVQMPGCAG